MGVKGECNIEGCHNRELRCVPIWKGDTIIDFCWLCPEHVPAGGFFTVSEEPVDTLTAFHGVRE